MEIFPYLRKVGLIFRLTVSIGEYYNGNLPCPAFAVNFMGAVDGDEGLFVTLMDDVP